MRISSLSLLRHSKFKFQRLVSFLLFRSRSGLQTNFGSFISPEETRIANDLVLHEEISIVMENLTSQEIDYPLMRLGSEKDGGYVVLEKNYDNSFLISGGISNDNNFEIAIAKLGAHGHQVDFSIDSPPVYHPNLTFSPQRIVGGENKTEPFDVSLDDLYSQFAPQDGRELLLKLDIEGAEWEVFETSNCIKAFSQIFLELHYMDRLGIPSLKDKSIRALNRLFQDFFPVFISGNNCCGFVALGGYSVPRVIELTLLNREQYEPRPIQKNNTNTLYQSQNYPARAPIVLKSW
jgi:hypothetical protein